MKKILFALLGVLLMIGVASAQWTPFYTNQMTVKWVASDTLVNGDPLPAEDSMEYEILIKQLPDGEEQVLGRTTELVYTVTVLSEGEWAIGLRAIRILASGSEVPSETNWSTENGEATPNPFSAMYILPPTVPMGLSPQ